MKRSSRSGLGLLELIIAVAILALLAVNAAMVSRTGSRVASSVALLSEEDNEPDDASDDSPAEDGASG